MKSYNPAILNFIYFFINFWAIATPLVCLCYHSGNSVSNLKLQTSEKRFDYNTHVSFQYCKNRKKRKKVFLSVIPRK